MSEKLYIRFREVSEKELRLAMEKNEPILIHFFYLGLTEDLVHPVYIEDLEKDKSGNEIYLYLKIKTITSNQKEWHSEAVIVVGSGEGAMFEPELRSA